MKKSCNWASDVLGAIPDTYVQVACQLDIGNAGSDTYLDDEWRHGCRNEEVEKPLSPARRRLHKVYIIVTVLD